MSGRGGVHVQAPTFVEEPGESPAAMALQNQSLVRPVGPCVKMEPDISGRNWMETGGYLRKGIRGWNGRDFMKQ